MGLNYILLVFVIFFYQLVYTVLSIHTSQGHCFHILMYNFVVIYIFIFISNICSLGK